MFVFPIVITFIAGLATAFGALAGSIAGKKYQAVSLSFATGLMLMIAMGELIPESSEAAGTALTLIFLATGMLVSIVLDLLFPHEHCCGCGDEHHREDMRLGEEPGHYINECECSHSDTVSRGMITALLLHNIVEGLATGLTATNDTRLGLTMALGIAIHNIPIGATLAVSVVSSGKSKAVAVLFSALVGLSQPLGALVGIICTSFTQAEKFLACCMACVAGTIIFIAFDELWPAARKNGSRKLTILSLLAGIVFIILTETVA